MTKVFVLLYSLSFVILNMIFSARLCGQNLVLEGKQWNMLASGGFSSPNQNSYALHLSGDTLLDGLTYLKVWISGDSLSTNWRLTGDFLREDQDQKVWLRSVSEPEQLLYDFNLLPGDSIAVGEGCTAYLIDIDTVELNNGALRKRLHFMVQNGFEEDVIQYWIEGIGSTAGLLEPWNSSCYTDTGGGLLCHFEDGLLVYPTNPSSCFIVPVGHIHKDAKVNVFPNPTADYLVIEASESDIRWDMAQLYNAQGKLVAYRSLTSIRERLQLADLAEGIYWLRLSAQTGQIINLKVIKQ